MEFLNKIVEQFIRANRKLKKWQRAVSILAAVVVFSTTYAFILPAITLDKETASAQSGIEIAASDSEPDSDGTVYEAEPEEEQAEEPQEEQEESGEQQDAEAVAEDSGSQSASQDAEVAEEENSDEDTAADHSQNTEKQTDKEAEEPAADEDTAPDKAEDKATAETAPEDGTAEEIKLITEETQLVYEYADEEYENGIDDENEDGIDDGYFVYAEFGADAKLPEGVELIAEEITKESDPEAYEAYYEKALSGLQDKYDENTALSFARFYDIKFIYNGEEVEPSGDVKVRIEYKKAVEIEKDTNVDAVHFDKNNGEEPEVIDSQAAAEKKGKEDTVKTVEFESSSFSVYGIIGSYTEEISANVLTADGKTYRITVSFNEDAEIPEGTELVVEEIDRTGYEHLQYLGRTWMEINKEYFEQKEVKDGEHAPGKEIPIINIDQACFFDITLKCGDKEIEPKAPVQVEISYLDGLGIDGIEERRAGVSVLKSAKTDLNDKNGTEDGSRIGSDDTETAKADEVELIGDIETSKDEEGRIVDFRFDQDSPSVTGIYVGHETRDAVMRVPQFRLAEGEGELETPDPHKSLVPNEKDGVEDGTYTLSLTVTGDRKEFTRVEAQKSNVLFIMDRSSSMNRYVRYLEPEIDPDETYYGSFDNGRTVFNVFYENDRWIYQERQGWSWVYREYDVDQYGLFLNAVRLPEEQEALKNLFQKLLGKNEITEENPDDDNIEIKIISFASRAGNNQGWQGTESAWVSGTSTTALDNAVNRDSVDSGTNWEEALKYAQREINSKRQQDGDEEDYYVIFLTDGAPTATTIHQTYYYGTEGHDGQYDEQGRPRFSCEPAYQDATDEARSLVADSGCKLYNIFTYGINNDYQYMIGLTNVAYGESDYDPDGGDRDPGTDAVNKYFTNATNTEKLVQAFEDIFSDISVTQGHVQVKITDGLRQDAMTSTFVNGKPSGVTYTVTPKDGTTPIYTVTATMQEGAAEPDVTFTINGVEYTTADGQVEKKTNPVNETEPLESYDAGEYYSVTVGDTEYKMALATVDNGGILTWDLTPVGMLLDDCVYKAEFLVWPNQDAYDYVAALNNGIGTITNSKDEEVTVVWDQSSASPVTDSEGNVYFEGGCPAYPSIVYYPAADDDYDQGIYNGTFAVLTNTDQHLDYSIITTEDGEVTDVDPQDPIPMEFPDPMPLEDTGSRIEKQWNIDRDPGVLVQYLYNTGGTSKEFKVKFNIYQGENTDPYKSVFVGWDETTSQYIWAPGSPMRSVEYAGQTYEIGTRWAADFSISAGLLLSEQRMTELKLDKSEYPSATFNGTKYYLLESGHDYSIEETGDVGYEFDFNAPVYHPMLVDGVIRDVDIEINGDEMTITGMSKAGEALSSLEIENTLRGYIHLNKIVVDKNGDQLPDDETKFEYTITLSSPTTPGPFTEDHIPWYAINDLFYHDDDFNYYQAEPLDTEGSLSLKTESGYTCTASCTGVFDPDIVGPTAVTFTDEEGDEKTINLYGNQTTALSRNQVTTVFKINQSERLSIANVPAETSYTITETQVTGYELVSIESNHPNEQDGYSISGTIVANADNNITFKNRCDIVDITIQKIDKNGEGLSGAVFQLKTVDGSAEAPATGIGGIGTVTKVIGGEEISFESAFETTGDVQTLTGLPDGTYRLYEVYIPEGYVSTLRYIEFTITDRKMAMVTEDSTLQFIEASGNKLALLKITNTPGAALPNAGGPGSDLIYILGIMLTGLAGAGLVMRKRRKAA